MKKITFDGNPREPDPRPGDILRTKTGRRHLIRTVRRVRSRVSPARFALEVEPYARVSLPPGLCPFGFREIPFAWYARGPKKATR